MSYADLAAAKTAFATRMTNIATILTNATGTAVTQKYNLGGPEQALLSLDEIAAYHALIKAETDAFYALFP